MQLRHPISARPLKPHHHDDIARERSSLERLDDLFLIIEHSRRRFDDAILRLHSRHFDDRPPEVAANNLQSTIRTERLTHRPQHGQVATDLRQISPGNLPVIREVRLLSVRRQPLPGDSLDILVKQPGSREAPRIRKPIPPAAWK